MQTTHYRHLEMQSVRWYHKLCLPLKELMVDPTLHEVCENTNRLSMNPIKLSEIFKPPRNQKTPPVRILVESPPLFGKTTLGRRLVQDWANGKQYMDNFKFAFLVFPERIKKDMTFVEWIIDLSRIDNMEDKWFQSMFTNRESQILIVVDNLDGYDDVQKKDIVALLSKQIFSKATVVAFVRTGCSQIYEQWEEKSHQRQSVSQKVMGVLKDPMNLFRTIKWNKRVYIEGLNADARRKFLKQYLTGDYFPEYARAYLDHLFDDYVEPLYWCPVYLFFLTRLNEESDFNKPKSRTHFFQHLINMHAGVHDSRDTFPYPKCIDIFDGDSKGAVYRNVFCALGNLCLSHFRNGRRYKFTEEELVDNCKELIMSLSLVKRELLPLKISKEVPSYEVQSIIAEFCIAYFLTVDSQSKKTLRKDPTTIVSMLTSSFFQHETNRWILLFMIGLLKENAGPIFDQLKPLAFLYKHNFKMFLPYVQECQEHLETVFASIKPFLPTDWWIHWSQYKPVFARSQLHETLIKLATANACFKSIRWHLGMPAKIPETVEVDKIELTIDMQHLLGLKSFCGKKLKCKELIVLYRSHGARVGYQRFINTFIDARTEALRLYAHDYDLVKILPHLSQLIQYNSASEFHIHCTLRKFPKDFSKVLLGALEKHPSNYHTLCFYLSPVIKSTHFPKIQQYVANMLDQCFKKANNLKVFHFSGDIEVPLQIPLESFSTENDDRKWSFIGFECMQANQFHLSNKINVEHLMWNFVNDQECFVEILNSCSNLKAITCRGIDANLQCLASNASFCETLYIKLDVFPSNFQDLVKIKHLRNLTLEFEFHEPDLARRLFRCLKHLTLSRLSLLSPPLETIRELLTIAIDSTSTPSYHVDTFHLDSPKICEEILPLQEQLLHTNLVSTIENSCWLHTVDFKIVEEIHNKFNPQKYIIDAANFDMTKPSDSETIWRHMFTIQRRTSKKC